MVQLLNYLLLPRISAHVGSGNIILGVVKRNPLFLHEIEWKNNGFLFTTPNMYVLVILHLSLDPAQKKSCIAISARTRIFSLSASTDYTVQPSFSVTK